MAGMRGVTVLLNELEKAKESLKDVDENIKRITGRDPTEQRPGPRRVTVAGDLRGRGRLFNQARRSIQEGDGPPVRRPRIGGAFSRLGPRVPGHGRERGVDSGDEDDLPNRPTIQSSVILTPRDSRSRKDALAEESKDGKGNERNRRMFGLLLGTLKKFKVEAKEKKEQEEHRKEIEQKLEDKAKQEKEELQKERRQLFLDRRSRQTKVRMIEQKMEIARLHEEWEVETRKLSNFIQTKAKPHIFYLPKLMNETLEQRLEDTTKIVEEMILKRREKLENEIDDLMNADQHEEGDEHGDEDMQEGEGGVQGSPLKTKSDKENRDSRRRRTSSGHETHDRNNVSRGSPQKRRRSDGNLDDRHDHSGKHRRLSKEEDDHRRRRRSDEGHRPRRRESEGGHRSSRRDREGHRSSRSDEKSGKKDVNKPEVRIDYEEEEGEVTNEDSVRPETEEKAKTDRSKEEVVKESKDIEMTLQNVVMPENGEEGEEGEVRDEPDE